MFFPRTGGGSPPFAWKITWCPWAAPPILAKARRLQLAHASFRDIAKSTRNVGVQWFLLKSCKCPNAHDSMDKAESLQGWESVGHNMFLLQIPMRGFTWLNCLTSKICWRFLDLFADFFRGDLHLNHEINLSPKMDFLDLERPLMTYSWLYGIKYFHHYYHN